MMQTIETTAIEPEADLRDCPFCGAEPYWLGVVIRGPSGRIEPHFYHPGVVTDKDCILSGQGYTLDEVAAWNARQGSAALPSEAMIEAGFRVLWNTELSELRDVPGNYKRLVEAIYTAMRATTPTAPSATAPIPNPRVRHGAKLPDGRTA